MLITSHSRYRPRRRGVILIVVLALLTLFTVLGIAFVLTADAQATASRIAREAETQYRGDDDPEAAFAFFLGKLLYGEFDDSEGVNSALRGHDLARGVYGWNDAGVNDRPFNGTGRIHETGNTLPAALRGATNPIARDGAYLINYKYFPADGFLRDPERLGSRANPTAALGTYVGGFNVPYTYPDHNNFYLGLIDPSTGAIVTPSFHREYLFGRLDSPTNPNWTNFEGKYLTLRPRPQENPNFPMPVDRYGDVKNLDGAPGGCDSIWIDINAPVQTAPDGRRYKMLVAPLLIQLDGRLDLNVLGNVLGASGGHRSNQGWGAWEVNPSRVLDVGTEWQNLFYGITASGAAATAAQARVPGRYDTLTGSRRPLGSGLSAGSSIRTWGQVDFNGMTDVTTVGAPSTAYTLPNSYYGFPDYPTGCFGNGGTENNLHPSIFAPFGPQTPNRRLHVSNQAALLRYGGTNADVLPNDLLRLLPQNLVTGANATKRRNLVTLLSADLTLPGAVPYVWDPTGPDTANEPAAAAATRFGVELDAVIGRWSPNKNQPIPFPNVAVSRSTVPNAGSDFAQASWRNQLSTVLGRVGINPDFPAYPIDTTTGTIITLDPSNPTQPHPKYLAAVNDRTAVAKQVYDVLRHVTGAMDPAAAFADQATYGKEFAAHRYLAQLAVNMVDFLDNDDFSTPFNWYPADVQTGWVFGVELPRLVINESYVQLDNYLDDLAVDANDNKMKVKAGGRYNVNVWVELLNPMPSDDPVHYGSAAADAAALSQRDVSARLLNSAGKPIYRVVLAKPRIGGTLRNLANPTGNPTGAPNQSLTAPAANVWTTAAGPSAVVEDWSTTDTKLQYVLPLPPTNRFGTAAPAAAGSFPEGFFVVGPNAGFVGDTKYPDGTDIPAATQKPLPNNYAPPNPNLPVTHRSPAMTYVVEAMPGGNAFVANDVCPTILLQRLANPGLPEQSDPTKPDYNPFLTIDYVEYTAFVDAANGGVNDARIYDTADELGAANVPAIAVREASGRKQPYAAIKTQRLPQKVSPAATEPKHSFFRQNSEAPTKAALDQAIANNATPIDATLTVPFDWLAHLDRPPVSVIDLLFVSDGKSADLLQNFVDASNVPHQHVAPWTNQASRLYRFLEFVEVRRQKTYAGGGTNLIGGRTTGRVNVNDVWNLEIMLALADAQGGNGFNDGEVAVRMKALMGSRSPGSVAGGPFALRPTDKTLNDLAVTAGLIPAGTPDRPFVSFGPAVGGDELGASPRGIDDSLLRNFGGTPVFDVSGARHPYKSKELLNKIYNSLTTRGNVFAVWMTVGFFEVDSQGRLGAELGKSENRHVRHRGFAIVDRTQMTLWPKSPANTLQNFAGVNVPTGPSSVRMDVTLPAPLLTSSPLRKWLPQLGSVITVDPDTANEETVVLQAPMAAMPPANTFSVTFRKSHAANAPFIVRGNPGPWGRYDPKMDVEVVPYFAVID